MNLDRLENKTVIWSLEFCPECDRIKKRFEDQKIIFEERDIEDLINGSTCYPKAIRQLIKQNYTSPVVCLNGEMKNIEDI